MKMLAATVAAVAGGVMTIAAMVPGEAVAWSDYNYVCDAWGDCIYRWLCY